MNKTARVILTEECNRGCVGCCNSHPVNVSAAGTVRLPHDMAAYEDVVLTGGEPMIVYPAVTLYWASVLKAIGVQRVYVYLSNFRDIDDINALLPWVDGITYTLHAAAFWYDANNFAAFQIAAAAVPHLSFRLSIHPRYPFVVPLRPEVWSRVQLLNWTTDCPAPEHEDLFIRRSLTDED